MRLLLLALLSPVWLTPSHAKLTAGPKATVLKDGQPFRAIGINYFNCFLRTLEKAEDTSYEAGFATLAAKQIPFARFCATGFWPADMKLYQKNRSEYFRRLDAVVNAAQKHGIGLIPSLFWNHSCVPDLVGEPMDQWANPQSKTQAWMRQYVREVVTRYRDHPAIQAWEFGNEYSLQASLPNAKEHRPAIHPTLGTPATRSAQDDLSFAMVRRAYTLFATEVRRHDPDRLIFSGDSFPRLSAWHQEHENAWTTDTPEQFAESLTLANPDPVNTLSVHAYENDDQRFASAMEVSRKVNKPLFVGEFGVPGDTPEQAATCRRMLKCIVDHRIPLAALWVFDFPNQQDFNVTTSNPRSWQLDLIAEANRQFQP
jgi:endo-1,4-beta-mannosidase